MMLWNCLKNTQNKYMTFVEKNFQALFTAWIKENRPDQTEVYELKVSKGRSIRFDALREHQNIALLDSIGESGLYHKIADSPVSWGMDTKMRFTKPKPFDATFIRAEKAYVVVLFYKLRQPKDMLFIDIKKWVFAEACSTKKSIREEDLRLIADKIIRL